MMVAIGIMALLAALSGPAIASLVRSSGPPRAVDQVSGLIENARQNAMRMGTWVWVGIADVADPASGEHQLGMVEVASRDGSSSLTSDNIFPLVKPALVRGVQSSVGADAGATVLGSAQNGYDFTWSIPNGQGLQAVRFSTMVIGFSPLGEATIASGAVPSWIKVSFASPTNAGDILSVLVSGPSGQVVVTR
jgi:Tfp pilus assembly protein FimT